jgi:hypothetical protein
MTNIDTDLQFKEGKIEEVHAYADGSWDIKWDGWNLLVPNDMCQQAPEVGETMRCYGKGIGYTVRGIAINGRVYRYRTAAEAEQDHREMVARMAKRRTDDYEAKRAEFEARVAALPEPFRLRIQRFRDLGGDKWRHGFEPYELFACEQAAAFADALKTVDDLDAFRALNFEEQLLRVPAMSDSHSGNTFGAACLLARGMIEAPELLPKIHGAMCGLVGCEYYGCFAAHEAKRGISP